MPSEKRMKSKQTLSLLISQCTLNPSIWLLCSEFQCVHMHTKIYTNFGHLALSDHDTCLVFFGKQSVTCVAPDSNYYV